MRKTIGIGAMTLVFAVAVGSAQADTRDPGVNGRQADQQGRIDQGVHSGQLTGQETRRLEREERHIAREERRFKSDGNLTGRERAKLQHDLNKSSRDIYRDKHDAAQH